LLNLWLWERSLFSRSISLIAQGDHRFRVVELAHVFVEEVFRPFVRCQWFRYPTSLRSRVSRLQFELNEKFKKNDVKDSEAPYELLDKKQRKNEFTGEHVSEAIDDARPENIEQLIKTAKAFLEEKEGCYYRTRNQKGIPVKDALRHFINNNS
jgi:hypothetical protein